MISCMRMDIINLDNDIKDDEEDQTREDQEELAKHDTAVITPDFIEKAKAKAK